MTDTDPLDGDTAVITGASSGIGAETARLLAADGANVVLAARREGRLEELVDELEGAHGVDAVAVPTNVREEAAVEALIDETVDTFGGLDVLVNNAGLARGSDVAELSTEDYRTMMETNVDGTVFATRAAIPHLVESEGHLVFLGSFAGQYPRPFNPVYAATKWAVRGFALSMEASLGPEGVAVTVVNPSEVRTEFGSELGEAFEDRFDPGEVTEPEEVAEAIRFAVRQDGSTMSEIDVYRRDKLEFF
ncbi:MAG: NADP-dependent 3-hydroxy acid dehydrogenase YdfG [Halobacteriales archaeon]|jgi:NADP-dependent 3-hydroxy acid dehydrogenase YdfG